MSQEVNDIIILGGGPAGLTAGIYTARQGLKTLILDMNELGGKARDAEMVENFPGFPQGLKGEELMDRFIAQAKKFGVKIKKETVIGLMDLGEKKIVSTREGTHESKAVIISTGIQRMKLSIPGEDDFKGMGVSYCAICDGPFFKDKDVAVIGSGHDAIEDALRLADIADNVYGIPGKDGYQKDLQKLDDLMKTSNINILNDVEPEEIIGDKFVTNLKLSNGKNLEVEGIFIILDKVPTNKLLSETGIKTDEGGCIMVDRRQRTNIKGIYAAGDCTCSGMQIVTAAGEGGQAALEALRYVKNLRREKQ